MWYALVLVYLDDIISFGRSVTELGLGPLRRGTVQPQQLWSTAEGQEMYVHAD